MGTFLGRQLAHFYEDVLEEEGVLLVAHVNLECGTARIRLYEPYRWHRPQNRFDLFHESRFGIRWRIGDRLRRAEHAAPELVEEGHSTRMMERDPAGAQAWQINGPRCRDGWRPVGIRDDGFLRNPRHHWPMRRARRRCRSCPFGLNAVIVQR